MNPGSRSMTASRSRFCDRAEDPGTPGCASLTSGDMKRTVKHYLPGFLTACDPVTGSLHAKTTNSVLGTPPGKLLGLNRAAGTLWRVARDSDPVTPPRSADARLRAGLLMPLAVLAVHQGRYFLAFGTHTPARLLRDGHAYLGSVIPFAVLSAALALGVLAGRLARAWQGHGTGPRAADPSTARPHSALRIWALCAFILFGLYCTQELTEGAVAAGHAGGIAGILGSGGWLAVPLAIVVAGILTLMLRGGDALVELLSGLRGRREVSSVPSVRRILTLYRADWRLAAACGVSAGRAPPVAFGHC